MLENADIGGENANERIGCVEGVSDGLPPVTHRGTVCMLNTNLVCEFLINSSFKTFKTMIIPSEYKNQFAQHNLS